MLKALWRNMFPAHDDDTLICAGLIDPSSLNWREEIRSRLLNDLDVQFISEGTSHDVHHYISCHSRALKRPCTSPINSDFLPGFMVLRTLPYVLEMQMT